MPAVVKGIENIIHFVNRRPKLIGTRNKRQPFGIADPASEDSSVAAIEFVLVNRTTNGIEGIGRGVSEHLLRSGPLSDFCGWTVPHLTNGATKSDFLLSAKRYAAAAERF
jgi:hypothetical protein